MPEQTTPIPTLFSAAQGGDRRPSGQVNWRCPACGANEVLVRWSAFGSQLGVIGADGRFEATAPADIYECEPWMSSTCAGCDERVPEAKS